MFPASKWSRFLPKVVGTHTGSSISRPTYHPAILPHDSGPPGGNWLKSAVALHEGDEGERNLLGRCMVSRKKSHPDERLSRFLTMVLRHRPQLLRVQLDEQGWVPVPELLEALSASPGRRPVDESMLRAIVRTDPKQRYELDEMACPARIRARYGHSVPVRLDYPCVEPPPVLFHGTARRFLGKIRSQGLVGRGRVYVHLTDDPQKAREVGLRRDPEPAILVIDARAMSNDGHVFFSPGGDMILTETVPPGYLRIQQEKERSEPKGPV